MGFSEGFEDPPDSDEAGKAARRISARPRASPAVELEATMTALRDCRAGSTRVLALDLVATLSIAVTQMMDDIEAFASSEGGAQVRLTGIGEAGLSVGQILRPGPGKTEGLAWGFVASQPLRAQGKDVEWSKQVAGLGVLMDPGLAMSSHLSQMRTKSYSALHAVATAARIPALSWEDYARVVPRRVMAQACFGLALVVHNPDAERRLNAMQRLWGASLFGL